MRKYIPLLLISLIPLFLQAGSPEVSGELKVWHKITLTFDGPEVSETDDYNPFVNYRFNVEFYHDESEKTLLVPGYFAADGNAGNTSASSGNKWRVHFSPDEIGEWTWKASFRKGKWVAISDKPTTGNSGGFMDEATGSFTVMESDKTGRDMRAKGRLKYIGEHYLRFAGNREYFLKLGPDAPENLLAYADFDGDFASDGHKDHFVKTWEAHLQDWKDGDPTWGDEKGKALIGAINYLASEGLNSFSFLTNNIVGDDQNVFPYIDYDTYDRFDVSKLDQWEVIFEHGTKMGFFLHFKTLEMENQGLLDNGGLGLHRKLYYRELIARFAHHPALNWNLCEENGEWVKNHPTPPQNTMERISMAQYFADHDPYGHHIVIHNGIQFDDLLGDASALTGVSLQTHHSDFRLVRPDTIKWRERSAAAGKKWAVAVDEPGDAQHSLVPDKDDPTHDDARKQALWGALLAGAWGLEWYFGYQHDHSDLTCQDFRSRDLFWDQCRYALEFFKMADIPYWKGEPMDETISEHDNFLFGQHKNFYVGLIKDPSVENKIEIKRSTDEDTYTVQWFNPREGGELQSGSLTEFTGGWTKEDRKTYYALGKPPVDDGKDWVVLVKKVK